MIIIRLRDQHSFHRMLEEDAQRWRIACHFGWDALSWSFALLSVVAPSSVQLAKVFHE